VTFAKCCSIRDFRRAAVKTELAGRGVGLDVVRSNLNALNGEIEVNSAAGSGTKFTLKVPLTLIISPGAFRALRLAPFRAAAGGGGRDPASARGRDLKTWVENC